MDQLKTEIEVFRAEGTKCPRCWKIIKGKPENIPCLRCYQVVTKDYPEFIERNAEEWGLVEKAYTDRYLHYKNTGEWLWTN